MQKIFCNTRNLFMRDLVYVVAVKPKDGKLPTSEKIVESRFFAEKKTAQDAADFYNNLLKEDRETKPYQVYSAIIEITQDSISAD